MKHPNVVWGSVGTHDVVVIGEDVLRDPVPNRIEENGLSATIANVFVRIEEIHLGEIHPFVFVFDVRADLVFAIFTKNALIVHESKFWNIEGEVFIETPAIDARWRIQRQPGREI